MSTSVSWTLDAGYDVPTTSSRFWLWTLVVGLAFFIVDQSPRALERVSWDAEVYSSDEFAEMISEGNALRQVMFLSLGLLGVYGITRRAGQSLDWRDPLLLTCAGFLAWCLLSVAWSADPGLSLRRGIRLLCIFAAALGLVRQFSPRELLRMIFIISFAWFVFSFGLELALGRFRPWADGYRFSAMMHPNILALHCGVLCLISISILRTAARTDWFVRGTLLAAGIAFLLTRSRTALAALVLALLVLHVTKPGARRLSWALALVLIIASAGLMAGLFGPEVDDQIASTLLLGRNEEVGSFTGRAPLWAELSAFAMQRPLTGFGYGAFWGPERAEIVAEALHVEGWSIPHAHSSYLDALLTLGVVGAGAMVIAMALALVRAARRYRYVPNAANTFLLSLLAFGAVDALAESSVMEPSYFYFLITCGILQLTFRADTET